MLNDVVNVVDGVGDVVVGDEVIVDVVEVVGHCCLDVVDEVLRIDVVGLGVEMNFGVVGGDMGMMEIEQLIHLRLNLKHWLKPTWLGLNWVVEMGQMTLGVVVGNMGGIQSMFAVDHFG